jgi:hypothetical protein
VNSAYIEQDGRVGFRRTSQFVNFGLDTSISTCEANQQSELRGPQAAHTEASGIGGPAVVASRTELLRDQFVESRYYETMRRDQLHLNERVYHLDRVSSGTGRKNRAPTRMNDGNI